MITSKPLTGEQLHELVEDIRKIWSPDINKTKNMKEEESSRQSAPKGYINKHEACNVMSCTMRTIDNWMRLKLIPYYKFGRRVYLKESDLIGAIEKHRVD